MVMGRNLLPELEVGRNYWPEIFKTAANLKTNTIERVSHYEVFFREKPTVKYLKVCGSKVFVRIHCTVQDRRKSKWGKNITYRGTVYRVLINNKVIRTRHSDIIEELCGVEDAKVDIQKKNGKDTLHNCWKRYR